MRSLDANAVHRIHGCEMQAFTSTFRVFVNRFVNLKPVVEVKSRRVGGATYKVPVEVRQDHRTALAMRWLIGYSRDRNEKSMREKLANEVLAAEPWRG